VHFISFCLFFFFCFFVLLGLCLVALFVVTFWSGTDDSDSDGLGGAAIRPKQRRNVVQNYPSQPLTPRRPHLEVDTFLTHLETSAWLGGDGDDGVGGVTVESSSGADMWSVAIAKAAAGTIVVRKDRSKQCGCNIADASLGRDRVAGEASDTGVRNSTATDSGGDIGRNVDFLARVHCFRRAGNIVLNDPTSRRVFKDTFKMMVAQLLADGDVDPHSCMIAIDSAERWVCNELARDGGAVRWQSRLYLLFRSILGALEHITPIFFPFSDRSTSDIDMSLPILDCSTSDIDMLLPIWDRSTSASTSTHCICFALWRRS
jgi:hypothetical protein